MDIQFYGANCITLTGKNGRVVIDDTPGTERRQIVVDDDTTILASQGNAVRSVKFVCPCQ